MDLTNEFTVPVPIERAWEVLTDVELIAPCLPGAQLQEIEGDEYRGIVKVKVGPISQQYKGKAVFAEKNVEERRLVLNAGGRDVRGQGSADAVITVTMVETDGSTHVVVNSDVTIKGKVAQFGRGMIVDVSEKLLTQFVECLEGKLGVTPAAEVAPASDSESDLTAAEPDEVDAPVDAADADVEAVESSEPVEPDAPTIRKINQPMAEPVDLLDAAGAPVAKRVAPVVAVLAVLVLLGKRRSKRRKA